MLPAPITSTAFAKVTKRVAANAPKRKAPHRPRLLRWLPRGSVACATPAGILSSVADAATSSSLMFKARVAEIMDLVRLLITRPEMPHCAIGGTDGSRLSFMGLPRPDIFAAEHAFHSRLEWVSRQDMERAVDTLVHLAMIWEQHA